jgi:hypothetical protein
MATDPSTTSQAPTTAQGQKVASWIWGIAFALFVGGVFCFAPSTLPDYKLRILAFACALLAACFGYFLTGSLGVDAQPQLPWLGKTAIKSGGGFAMFLVVLVWWHSPAAPVQLAKEAPQPNPAPTTRTTPETAQKYDPDAFVNSYVYSSRQIAQVEYVPQEGALPAARQQDFLTLSEVAYDYEHGVMSVMLKLHNVMDSPVGLALKEDFFAVEDDTGQKATLIHSNLPTGILAADDSRSVRLYFQTPHGWWGKRVSARNVFLHVYGLLPVVRATWKWPTLAMAD